VPVVLFQNTNWGFTFKNGVLLWILKVLERRKFHFTWPSSCLYTFVKCFFCWSWWPCRDIYAICEGAVNPFKERQKLLLLVPGVLNSYPRNLRGREPISRKGVHLSAANTKWRILTHSVSEVVRDLLRARVRKLPRKTRWFSKVRWWEFNSFHWHFVENRHTLHIRSNVLFHTRMSNCREQLSGSQVRLWKFNILKWHL